MLRDLLLPATDRMVAVQVVVTVLALAASTYISRNTHREIRLFIWGVFSMILRSSPYGPSTDPRVSH